MDSIKITLAALAAGGLAHFAFDRFDAASEHEQLRAVPELHAAPDVSHDIRQYQRADANGERQMNHYGGW